MSSRDPRAGGVPSLVDKIKQNKFITDGDMERQKFEEIEAKRRGNMRKVDEDLLKQ